MNALIKRFNKNEFGRDFVVGDIHGCFLLLEELLHQIGFDTEHDRLFSVGDLVDRGPDSCSCLDWLRKPWFHAVLGNHEKMAFDYMEGYGPEDWYIGNGGAWFVSLQKPQQIEYLEAFMDLPIAIEVETNDGVIGIIHAECPTASWADLSDAIAGENSGSFIELAVWSRKKITHGNDDAIAGIKAVFCGHTPIDYPIQLGNVYYIDTGAVYGRSLTMFDLDNVDSPIQTVPQGETK